MSVGQRLLAGEEVELAELRTASIGVLFGNYVGATIFLVALAWFGLYWRLGFFSNDQFTFANTVLGLADGHLYIDQVVYGPDSGSTPGTHLVDGRVYGRNYGIVVVAVLWYVLLKLLSLLVDVRILVVGLWSIALAGAIYGAGRWFDRRRDGLRVGIALATLLFVGNVAVATPLSAYWLPQLALQLTTAMAAAFVAVVCYRLVERVSETPVAIFAGLAVVVATPVGFWATLPKRHSVTALLVVCAMYTLYRSRDAPSITASRRFRALTYVLVGLAAWVHAAEGLILLLAIVLVDLPTARSNRFRDLLVVGAALFLSLVPFFVTNVLISGNPFEPPRMLPGYGGNVLDGGSSGGQSAVGSVGGSGDGSSGSIGADVLRDILSFEAAQIALLLLGLFERSIRMLTQRPADAIHLFVRSGYIDGLRPAQDAAINLSILESLPLLATATAVPALAVRRLTAGIEPRSPTDWRPIRVLDSFTIIYTALLFGLFLGPLPIHHMFTVRYLHPLYAVGVYWLVRIPAVTRAITSHARLLVGATVATVVVGVPAYLLAIAAGDFVLGEAVQLYALVALAIAVAVAVWTLAQTIVGGFERLGAILLGVAVGTMAVYLLVSGLSLFPTTGEFALPLARTVSEQIHYARLLGSTPPS